MARELLFVKRERPPKEALCATRPTLDRENMNTGDCAHGGARLRGRCNDSAHRNRGGRGGLLGSAGFRVFVVATRYNPH